MSDREPPDRVGVYPGSFNPPTVAHLAIAEAAAGHHGLHRVDLTVSRSALAKEHVDHPRFEHRIEILERVAADLEWLAVRVTEHQLLADIATGYDVLIVGADKWLQIQDPAWYGDSAAARDQALGSLPTVAVVPRDDLPIPGELRLDVPSGVIEAVSSTAARAGDTSVMAPAARDFAERTGAWIDEARYDRWLGGARPR